jgi:hypothetical protein
MTHHFPTPEHKKAAEKVIEIYQQFETVDVILLVNSLARAKGMWVVIWMCQYC